MKRSYSLGLATMFLMLGLSIQGCAAGMNSSQSNPGLRECGQYMLVGGIAGLAVGTQVSDRREAAAAGGAIGATAGYAICRRAWITKQHIEQRFAELEAEIEAERVARAEAQAKAAEATEAAAEARELAQARPDIEPAGGERLIRSVEVVGNRATRLNLNSALMFDVGESALRRTARAHLGVLAESLVETEDNHACIIGHTDSTGPLDLNMQLSEDRAREVASYLSNNGVPAGRIHIEGKGPSQPVGDNATSEGRQENRRVEILLVPDQVERRQLSGDGCPFVI